MANTGALGASGEITLRVRIPSPAPSIISTMTEQKRKPGPKPDRVKIDENWEDAVTKALKKKRPKSGWPKPDKPQTRKSD